MLYLFNENNIKIAKLADPRKEKNDDLSFFRLLFNVTIGERDITNQFIGTTYFLRNLNVEDFKYKFSKNEVDNIIIDFTECSDLRFNVTYTINNRDILCQKAKEYINSKIDDVVNDYLKYIIFYDDIASFGSAIQVKIQKQSIYIYI